MDVARSSSKGGIARRCTRPIAGGAQNKHYARLELTIPNQSFQYRTAALRASPSPGPITHRQREQPGHANARCRLCELQVCRPGRADEQLEGDGWLGVGDRFFLGDYIAVESTNSKAQMLYTGNGPKAMDVLSIQAGI